MKNSPHKWHVNSRMEVLNILTWPHESILVYCRILILTFIFRTKVHYGHGSKRRLQDLVRRESWSTHQRRVIVRPLRAYRGRQRLQNYKGAGRRRSLCLHWIFHPSGRSTFEMKFETIVRLKCATLLGCFCRFDCDEPSQLLWTRAQSELGFLIQSNGRSKNRHLQPLSHFCRGFGKADWNVMPVEEPHQLVFTSIFCRVQRLTMKPCVRHLLPLETYQTARWCEI